MLNAEKLQAHRRRVKPNLQSISEKRTPNLTAVTVDRVETNRFSEIIYERAVAVKTHLQ
jgi:hypothetical protein